jgi:hypothetical protein
MNSKLENVKDRKVKEKLLETIGKIGSSKSYEAVHNQLSDGRKFSVIETLGLIRDPRVKDVLKEYSNRRLYWREQQAFFKALGNTRDPEWLPILHGANKRRVNDRTSAQIAIRMIEAVQRFQHD